MIAKFWLQLLQMKVHNTISCYEWADKLWKLSWAKNLKKKKSGLSFSWQGQAAVSINWVCRTIKEVCNDTKRHDLSISINQKNSLFYSCELKYK